MVFRDPAVHVAGGILPSSPSSAHRGDDAFHLVFHEGIFSVDAGAASVFLSAGLPWEAGQISILRRNRF